MAKIVLRNKIIECMPSDLQSCEFSRILNKLLSGKSHYTETASIEYE